MTNQDDMYVLHFAVCLAAHNGRYYIAEQIDSILQQVVVSIEMFISVDKSTDGTEDCLAKWALAEPRLILLPFGRRFGGAGPISTGFSYELGQNTCSCSSSNTFCKDLQCLLAISRRR